MLFLWLYYASFPMLCHVCNMISHTSLGFTCLPILAHVLTCLITLCNAFTMGNIIKRDCNHSCTCAYLKAHSPKTSRWMSMSLNMAGGHGDVLILQAVLVYFLTCLSSHFPLSWSSPRILPPAQDQQFCGSKGLGPCQREDASQEGRSKQCGPFDGQDEHVRVERDRWQQ